MPPGHYHQPINDYLKERFLELVETGYRPDEAARMLDQTGTRFKRIRNQTSVHWDAEFANRFNEITRNGGAHEEALAERLEAAAIERGLDKSDRLLKKALVVYNPKWRMFKPDTGQTTINIEQFKFMLQGVSPEIIELLASEVEQKQIGPGEHPDIESGMSSIKEQTAKAILEERDRRQREEEAEQFSGSLVEFVKAAWPALKPDDPYLHNWHINAICEHLEAVSRGEITRLQVWVPPVSMKTLLVSVMWPAWEWTFQPRTRYWGASYSEPLAGIISSWSRQLLTSDWYQARWAHVFKFVSSSLLQFSNDRGGTRLSTSPEGKGTGLHGHRILIDDPIKPDEADATSRAKLDATNRWWDSTVSSRGIGNDFARIIVMQRLHENDLCGHTLAKEHWEVLALPERHWPTHPYAWNSDPRTEGDLLWPEFRNEERSNALAKDMLPHRAAGQLQQWPTTREGEILKRHWWRFYHPDLFRVEKLAKRRPKFARVVISVDTPLKDKESNDLVAIQAWGRVGADSYLLDLKKGHMNFHQAKRAILEQSDHVRKLYPRSAHKILIENAGYGVKLIQELKREVTGVEKITRGTDGDKELRAEAAAADLESGNCFLPGWREGNDEFSMPDEKRCSADVVDFIDSCAIFPNGRNDDDVNAWSQAINWLRMRQARPARTLSSFRVR